MELQQAASVLQIDLAPTLSRFGGNEALYRRFLKKLKGDPSFENLTRAVQDENRAEIEHCAHALKGVSANLGLTALQTRCDALVRAMREQRLGQTLELFIDLSAQYRLAIDTLDGLD